MYCMPRRWRISSANNAEPSGAPNSTVNAAAMPAIVTQRASSTGRLALARDPTRERAARRDERRLRTGRAAGRDREQRHRDRATAACARRRGARHVDVVDEQFDVARAAEHATDHDDRDAGRAQHRELRGVAPVVGPEHVLQEVERQEVQPRRPAPLASRRATVAPSSVGRHAQDAVIEEASAEATSRTYRSTISAMPADHEPNRAPATARRRRLPAAPRPSNRACASSCTGASSRRLPSASRPAQHQLLLAIRGHPRRDAADDRRRRRRVAAPPPQRGRARRPGGDGRPRRAAHRPRRPPRRAAAPHRARRAPAPPVERRPPRGAAAPRAAHAVAVGQPRLDLVNQERRSSPTLGSPRSSTSPPHPWPAEVATRPATSHACRTLSADCGRRLRPSTATADRLAEYETWRRRPRLSTWLATGATSAGASRSPVLR